jgi:hypothetical protein
MVPGVAMTLVLIGGSAALRPAAQTAATAPPATPLPPRPAPAADQSAIQAASEKDHQRLLDLLGIKELRPPVGSDSKSPHAANYDESKANPYPNLPDPLLLKNGKHVTSDSS